MTRSCAVNADAVPSSERSAKMAAMRVGPWRGRYLRCCPPAGSSPASQPAWAGRGRPLSGWPATWAARGCMLWIGIIAMFFTATWQRSRAGAESIVSALLTRKDGHSVYAC